MSTVVMAEETSDPVPIAAAVLQSDFVKGSAARALRVTCYGSSSSDTPEPYLREARSLGYILAKRGHTCVNGAGSYGCMAAMNDGAARGDGHVIGVIHEMWLQKSETLRDGGAHPIFESTENAPATASSSASSSEQKHGGPHPLFNGAKRQMLVAGGNDLQERKRLLVDKADALVVLPGGPGTWDELWEMACAKGIGLSNLPIVCVSVGGYYEPFAEMLRRAYADQLTKLQPHEIVHFVDTALEAVQWIEAIHSGVMAASPVESRKAKMALRSMSVLHNPVLGRSRTSLSFTESIASFGVWSNNGDESYTYTRLKLALTFAAGVAVGLVASARNRR